MKVALVHDFLSSYTGAERVLAAISKLYPEAPIYTLLYEKEGAGDFFVEKDVRSSFLEKLPSFIKKRRKFLLPLLATATESLDLTKYDLVISSSGAWSKGVITRSDAIHICYCHTPMRFVWDYHHQYKKDSGLTGIKGLIASPLISQIRLWDRVSAERVDHFIANSKTVAERIKKYYRRDATVIYPNVDIERFSASASDGDYFLSVGRLEPYKNVALLVDTFNQREDLKLKIVGTGSQYEKLKRKIKSKNIELLGYKNDAEVKDLMLGCRAFLFPVNDDFGITPVEAMAAGKPVIALYKGGVRETVIEGETGIFFSQENTDSLIEAINKFSVVNWSSKDIRKRAEQFSEKNFMLSFKQVVDKVAS